MPVAHSYSRLSTFENCPAKYDYIYNSKRVKDPGNVHTEYGNRVHEKLEKVGQAGEILTDAHTDPEVAPFLPLVRRLLEQPGEKLFEYKMAITPQFEPCEWMAPEVWVRSIADVLVINGEYATMLDWKTGKVRQNPTQMQLFAAMVLTCFPQVERVKTAFVWLNYNDITPVTYARSQLNTLWGALRPRMEAVEDAVALGVFRAKPSGLCPWCPAKTLCPSARIR